MSGRLDDSRRRRVGAALAMAMALAATPAFAGESARLGRDTLATAAAEPPAYRQECAACHLAYPAALLPADAWRRVMGGLPTHYGVDASLDDATRAALTDWLVAHAGSGRRARDVGPDDRITRTAWFQRKHHEVPPQAWTRPTVKSASQCSACHPGAEQGDFDEDRVRIPR